MNSHNGLENKEKLNTECLVLRTENGGLKIFDGMPILPTHPVSI